MKETKIKSFKVAVVLDIVLFSVLFYLNRIFDMGLLIWPRIISFIGIILVAGVILYIGLLALFLEQYRKNRNKDISTGITPILKDEPRVVTFIGEENNDEEYREFWFLFKIISKLADKSGCYFEVSKNEEDDTDLLDLAIVYVDEDGDVEEKTNLIKISPAEFVENFAFVDFEDET